MNVGELKEALNQFKPTGNVSVVVPTAMQRHVRALNLVGHADKPDSVDPNLPLEIFVDSIDGPPTPRTGKAMQVTDLLKLVAKFPDNMHVRVAVPVNEETHSHRILDILTVGFTTGTGQGAGVELIGEPWESQTWILRGVMPLEERERLAAAADTGTSA